MRSRGRRWRRRSESRSRDVGRNPAVYRVALQIDHQHIPGSSRDHVPGMADAFVPADVRERLRLTRAPTIRWRLVRIGVSHDRAQPRTARRHGPAHGDCRSESRQPVHRRFLPLMLGDPTGEVRNRWPLSSCLGDRRTERAAPARPRRAEFCGHRVLCPIHSRRRMRYLPQICATRGRCTALFVRQQHRLPPVPIRPARSDECGTGVATRRKGGQGGRCSTGVAADHADRGGLADGHSGGPQRCEDRYAREFVDARRACQKVLTSALRGVCRTCGGVLDHVPVVW
jgi:hypothetical protein